jgi:transposase-like protein
MSTPSPLAREAPNRARTSQRYSAEIKAEAVKRVRHEYQSVSQVSRDLAVKAGSIYLWLRKADVLGLHTR